MPTPLKFDERGLIPVVAQDAGSGAVLMLAFADDEAVGRTRATGFAHFYSRSRGKLWMKGETSGNRLAVREIRIDCDGDSLLYRCVPEGPTCHTGEYSCFSERLSGADDRVGAAILTELEAVLKERRRGADPGSYTAGLLSGDPARIRKKIQEEAFELVLGAEKEDAANMAQEAADLLVHAMILLVRHGVELEEVFRALKERRGNRRPE